MIFALLEACVYPNCGDICSIQTPECLSGISYTGFRGEGWSDNPQRWLDTPRTMGCKLREELDAQVVKEKN